MNETVPPSSEPDSATATGTGGASSGATPPPSPAEGAGDLHPQTGQDGASAPPAEDAPLHLSEGALADDQEPQSPSGT